MSRNEIKKYTYIYFWTVGRIFENSSVVGCAYSCHVRKHDTSDTQLVTFVQAMLVGYHLIFMCFNGIACQVIKLRNVEKPHTENKIKSNQPLDELALEKCMAAACLHSSPAD